MPATSSHNPVSFLAHCSAVVLGDCDIVPEWVMVIPAGVSQGVDGRGPYNNDQPDAVVANSAVAARPLPFDYNHQTLFAALHGSPSPASGWIDRLENRDGAIWAHVDWTDTGRAAVAARHYRFISPVFKHDKSGRVERLVSAALVNSPNLRELPAINTALAALYPQAGEVDLMDKTEQARLAAALGLAGDASIDAIVAHAESIKDVAHGAPDPAKYVPMAAFTELQAQVAQLQGSASQSAALAMVDGAATVGKLTPAMREWGLSYATQNPEGFQAWCDAAPVIMAGGVDPNLAGAGDGGAAQSGALTKQELAVCTQLGVTPEDYATSKQKAA